MNRRSLILLTTLIATLAVAATAFAGPGLSFTDAKAKAAASGKPVLLKVEASWCNACKKFDVERAENAEFSGALRSSVVLVQVDGEIGDGAEIAREYHARGYPTFVLMNAQGETINRWHGYHDTESFMASLDGALADPTTMAEKLDRYRRTPNAQDAVTLGDLRMAEGYYAEANALFARAAALGTPESLEMRRFQATLKGTKGGLYTAQDVVVCADAIVASGNTEELMGVLGYMKKMSVRENDSNLYVPYLTTFINATADVGDGKMAKVRTKVYPEYVLLVEKDTERAVALKRDAMPEGWETDSNLLNNFAWWCFEHKVNLDEAEQVARKGIELAASGNEKGNIYDTLAEICNEKGDCGDAVEYIRLALAEDPGNEYFQRQLDRFEELLAQSQE